MKAIRHCLAQLIYRIQELMLMRMRWKKQKKKEGSEKIEQGYKRMMEKIQKIKDKTKITQSFSNAVTNGRRSGLVKNVQEHYDALTNLFSVSPSVESLKFGLDSSSSSISTNIDPPGIYLEVENDSVCDVTNDGSGSILADVESDSSAPNIQSTRKFNNERKGDDENCFPRLIDNKYRHLEKILSHSQRDEILLKEAKKEDLFKMELNRQ